MLIAIAALAALNSFLSVPAVSENPSRDYFATVDGQKPSSALVGDASGGLYGTTYYGGKFGYGSVFKLTPTNAGYVETIVYSFKARPDGENPLGGLIVDESGALYGTTQYGGQSQLGTAFKLTPGLTGYRETILYYFQGSNGSNPQGSLLADGTGAFYGTDEYGPLGYGFDFKLTPASGGYDYATIYEFPGGFGGGDPVGSLIADSAGNLYGTTYGDQYDGGTVYKLTLGVGGYTESVIYHFNSLYGKHPSASLAIDSTGALYGTTSRGGSANKGVVFKFTPAGSGYSESVLYNFTGGAGGAHPQAGIAVAPDGSLFGTAMIGGTHNAGVVFALTPSGGGYDFSVLHNFAGDPDGANPIAAVIEDRAGDLFGTTMSGGTLRNGSAFSLTPNSKGYREKVLHSF